MNMPDMEKDLDFPINHELVEAATQSMEEWKIIKDRLKKIDEHKQGVSDKVYERVKQDYESRLSDATSKLLEKKVAVDNELAALAKTRQSIDNQLEDHRQKLEEINFRNTLGEFSETEFAESSKTEQAKISKFETIVNAVDNNIRRYESIFEGDNDLFAKQEASAPEEEISEIADSADFTPARHEAAPPVEEDEFQTDEMQEEALENDYFSSPFVEDQPVVDQTTSNPAIRVDQLEQEDSNTKKAPIDLNVERPHDIGPRVVIINGDNAGAAYPLKSHTSLGRADSSTIPVKDAKCSRQHAQIQQHGNEYMITDLNSSNGTYINGEKIEEHVLSNGDEILIGDTLMQFQTGS